MRIGLGPQVTFGGAVLRMGRPAPSKPLNFVNPGPKGVSV
jgi:hypothetical protein